MISFPWDNTSSTVLDRNVSSDTLAEKYFDMLAGGNCGIYAPVGAQGSVSPGTGMNVVVQPVAGVIKGRIYSEVDARTLAIQASEAQDRIDTVVIRRDKAGRGVDLYIVKGTAATTPVRPALTRSGDIYEVGIADLFIAATTTSITAQRITDTRSETARCQIIPVVGSIDTTTMFNQYQAALDAYLDLVQQAIDETLAGNLQSQIDASEAIIAKHDGNFAGAYSAASTYALNTFVIYANDLYKCTTAITVAEAWTAGHWTKVSVGAELNGLITSLNWYVENGILPPIGSIIQTGYFTPELAVASSLFSASYPANYSYDGNGATFWIAGNGVANIVYTFPKAIKVTNINIQTSNEGAGLTVGSLTYYGSNDNVNFTQLGDTLTRNFDSANNTGSPYYYDIIPNVQYYKYIKVAINTSNRCGIKEIKFYGSVVIS